MKKILLSVIMLFMVSAFFSVHAQVQDSQEEIQTLTQRVDSLEHELSYLKMSYDLSTLRYEINMTINEVDIKCLRIKSDIDNREFDSRYGNAYQRLYEAFQANKQSTYDRIGAVKLLYTLKIAIYPYSESELNVLKKSYESIDRSYASLEGSMDMLKIYIDMYNDCLQILEK